MNEEFNGWSNRETWATALHINNDSGLYEPVTEKTKEMANDETVEHKTATLADIIEQFIDEILDYENIKENRNAFSMLSDIGSLYRVNWREIADSLLSDIKADV